MGAVILVGSTVAAWKCDGSELDWLKNAEAMREASPVPLEFFCAVQVEVDHTDRPEIERFFPLADRLDELDPDADPAVFSASRTSFVLAPTIWGPTTRGRLIGITTGRNLVREHALRDTDATHVLFLDTDVTPDPECVPKLLELDHPVVGGDVPKYCLKGPQVVDETHDYGPKADQPLFPFRVEEHWNTAGFLLVRRDVLRQVAWRWECDTDVTDDPCFALDVERAGFGKTWVRKDCVGEHVPLVPVEKR